MTWDDQTGVGLQAWECSELHICFWTGRNGTGSRCTWDIADPDWTSGGIVCSWAKTKNVASVMNLGTSSDGSTGVAYYTSTDYNNRIGCTRNQHGGNLAGTYQLRSHKWISGSCG
ncbi:MAG: peptidase inhibitor family I36 protein [Labedaea sp.]